MRIATVSILCLLVAVFGEGASARAEAVAEDDVSTIAVDAYTYLYPLVLMEITRRVQTNRREGEKPGSGPMNRFLHVRSYPTSADRDVVRPNFDTLYSLAWLDLRGEPLIVSVPDTAGRYYTLPLSDMWTDVFAAPGSRISGTSAADWAVVPPGWKGSLPAGVRRIDATTPTVRVSGRIQTNGPADYDNVRKLQDRLRITPLSLWGKPAEAVVAAIDPAIDTNTEPLRQVSAMPAARFFALGLELMSVNGPHATDWSMLERMRRIGLTPGESFDLEQADPPVRAALEQAPPRALQRIKAAVPMMGQARNGWIISTSSMGVYGNDYLKRALIALVGLGANPPDETLYAKSIADTTDRPLSGERRYVLHFPADQLPPVRAFWSVAIYDAEGYQVANPLNRYALGDRDALHYNSDGSLDLYMQHEPPGADYENNWLPTPGSGALGVTMRLYVPQAAALEGRWAPPAIRQVE